MPSINAPCEPVAEFAGIIALDCAITYGVSGAPVLALADGSPRVVAVVVGDGRVLAEPREVTLTVPLAPQIDALRVALAEAPLEAARTT